MTLRSPAFHGSLVGLLLPFLLFLPALFAGRLGDVLAQGATRFLLPAFLVVALPAGLAGFQAARRYPERRDAWRFSMGLFLGGSLFAAILFWIGGEGEAIRRLVNSAFGGAMLGGFWPWFAALLGMAIAYSRDKTPEAGPAKDL